MAGGGGWGEGGGRTDCKDSREGGGGWNKEFEREEKWNSATKAGKKKPVADSDKCHCSLVLYKWRADNK